MKKSERRAREQFNLPNYHCLVTMTQHQGSVNVFYIFTEFLEDLKALTCTAVVPQCRTTWMKVSIWWYWWRLVSLLEAQHCPCYSCRLCYYEVSRKWNFCFGAFRWSPYCLLTVAYCSSRDINYALQWCTEYSVYLQLREHHALQCVVLQYCIQ